MMRRASATALRHRTRASTAQIGAGYASTSRNSGETVGTGAAVRLQGERSCIEPSASRCCLHFNAAPELGIGAEDVAAYGKIAKLVSSWALAAKQARDVKAMLKTYGDDMDRLLGAMQRAARSYEGVLQQEKASADSIQMLRLTVWKQPKSGDGLLGEARRDAIVAMSNNSYAGIAERQAKALQAAAAASQGLAQVRNGHAAMLKDADRLKSKQLQALLKQAVADMKTVRAQLDAL